MNEAAGCDVQSASSADTCIVSPTTSHSGSEPPTSPPPAHRSLARTAGLWQLFAVKNEAQDHSFVSKQVPQVEHFEELSNTVAPGSFDFSAREVDFRRLDRAHACIIGLVGSNEDVWDALCHVGIQDAGVPKESLKEGLYMFCQLPSNLVDNADAATALPGDLPDITDCLDTDSDLEEASDARTFYVFVRAGKDVHQEEMHPPFNLALRQLLELATDVNVVVNAADAALLDDGKKPFKTVAGYRKTFAVERKASEATAVEVGNADIYHVELPSAYSSVQHTASMSCVSTRWHQAAQSARAVHSWHVTGSRKANKHKCVDGGHGLESLSSVQVTLSAAWADACKTSMTAVDRCMNTHTWKHRHSPSKQASEVLQAAKESPVLMTAAALLGKDQLEPIHQDLAEWECGLKQALQAYNASVQTFRSITAPGGYLDAVRMSSANWRLSEVLSAVTRALLGTSPQCVLASTFLHAFAQCESPDARDVCAPLDVAVEITVCEASRDSVTVQLATAPPRPDQTETAVHGTSLRDARPEGGHDDRGPSGPLSQAALSSRLDTGAETSAEAQAAEQFVRDAPQEVLDTICKEASTAAKLTRADIDDEVRRAVAAVHVMTGTGDKSSITTATERELAFDICEVGWKTYAAAQTQNILKTLWTWQSAKANFSKDVQKKVVSLPGVDHILCADDATMLREVVAARFVQRRARSVMQSVWRKIHAKVREHEGNAAAAAAESNVRARMSSLKDFLDQSCSILDAALSSHNKGAALEQPAAPRICVTKIEGAWAKMYKIVYAVDEQTSGLAYLCTHVQSRSKSGESSQVHLAARVELHSLEQWVAPESLLLLSCTESRPAKLIRVDCVRQTPTKAATEVFVYPVNSRLHDSHRIKMLPLFAAAATYEPSTRVLAIYYPDTRQGPAVGLFAFDAEYNRLTTCRELFIAGPQLRLMADGTLTFEGSSPCVLLPRPASGTCGVGQLQDKMALIITPGKVELFNCTSGCYERRGLEIDTLDKQWFPTPNCAALLMACYSRTSSTWRLEAFALEEAPPSQALFAPLGPVELPSDMQQLPEGTRFTAVTVGSRMYMLAACAAYPDRLLAAELKVRSIKLANKLASTGTDSASQDAMPWSNKLLNYFHSVCERFPLDDCLQVAMLQSLKGAARRAACRQVDIHLCTERAEDAERLQEYFTDLRDAVLNSTQKPYGTCLRLEPSACTDLPSKLKSLLARGADCGLAPIPFGAWLRHAMCLAPLQISRCSGNTLEPMHDGECRPVEAADTVDIITLSDRLRLGLYECLLNAHGGPVIVVCAIGQQSVGKSYQLNHLGGVFLDVAGGRCTDGIWLTARHFTDEAGVSKLLLFLDCEGIGSLERTETEDMLHCLLAAAVSSFTMFKTHFAFNRELDETLKRLNKGAQKVQSISGESATSGIFQGSIMFCLKDVQDSAMRPTVDEFQDKLQQFVQEEENFVTSMFQNAVSVAAFAPLSRGFYKTLEKECVREICNPRCPGYPDGRKALQIIKLMLVKMAHKDWTPIDRQCITTQASALRALMHAACHFGCCGTVDSEGLASDESTLLPRDQDPSREIVCFELVFGSMQEALRTQQLFVGKKRIRAALIVCGEAHSSDIPDDAVEAGPVELVVQLVLDDHKLSLGHLEEAAAGRDGPTVQRVRVESVIDDYCAVRNVLIQALELDRPSKDAAQYRLLHAASRALLAALVKRRERRCMAWLQAAVAEFADSPEASELQNLLSVYLQRLEASWTLCGAGCALCHLPCAALGAHPEHSCHTDHRCHAQCDFCVKEGLEVAAACRDKAGHTGRHMCATQTHACGKECKLVTALNCRGTCRKQPDHDGDCDCESGNHLCGEPCDLPGCSGLCTQPYGSDHGPHACGDTGCPERCPLCDRRCPEDHFHAIFEPDSHHLCGREHACVDPETHRQRLCASAGVCAFAAQIQTVEKRVFRGRADEFEYDHHTLQIIKQDVCTKAIPPGRLEHEGPCCCARKAEEHFCGHQCPACTYRCTKHNGHDGRHRMQHGNMIGYSWVSNRDIFEVGDRKYGRGDTCEAETCDSACSRMGRGHRHLLHCDKQALCGSAMHDGIRHLDNPDLLDGNLQPLKDRDQCTHDFYWKHLDIEDPCLEQEKKNFRMCSSTSSSKGHRNSDGTRTTVHCLLPVWHAPLDPADDPGRHLPQGISNGYITSSGCLFPGRHRHSLGGSLFSQPK